MSKILLAVASAFVLFLASPAAAAPWTDFPLRDGARIVHVSSSDGNDADDGLTPATAKRTMMGGFALIRDGAGDQLRLRRGDTFSEPYLLVWNRSGFSAAYPAVLGTYGSGPRPIVDRGTDYGMHVSPRTGPTVRHLAISGIHFRAEQRDWRRPDFTAAAGRPGIFVAAGGATAAQIVDDLLIEDCKFELLGGGVSLVGPRFDSIRNVRINRNVFADIYALNGHTNAIYASNVTGLTVEENLIDGVQRTAIAAGVPNVPDSALSHAVYVQSDTRTVTLQGNIMTNAFDGGMMRPGGVYSKNLVVNVSIGVHYGYMFSASAPIISEGVEASITTNAFLQAGQYGIQMGNVRQGFVGENVFLSGPATGGLAFNLIGRTDQDTTPGQIGLHNVTVAGNFVLGMNGISSAGPVFSNVAFSRNQFRAPSRIVNHIDYEAGDFEYAGNAYRSEAAPTQWFRAGTTNYDLPAWTAFVGESNATAASAQSPASAPTLATYHASIGGTASDAAFLEAARNQSRESWDDRYMSAAVIVYLRRQLSLLPGTP